jgi:hypothetical protein
MGYYNFDITIILKINIMLKELVNDGPFYEKNLNLINDLTVRIFYAVRVKNSNYSELLNKL